MTDDRLPGCLSLAVATVIIFVALASLSGCQGTTPVQQQTPYVGSGIALLHGAGEAIEGAVTHDLDVNCASSEDTDACADQREATTWASVRTTYVLLRVAFADWIVGLELASQTNADPITTTRAIVQRLVDTYHQLVAALRPLGVTLPDIPEEIMAFLPATSGGEV